MWPRAFQVITYDREELAPIRSLYETSQAPFGAFFVVKSMPAGMYDVITVVKSDMFPPTVRTTNPVLQPPTSFPEACTMPFKLWPPEFNENKGWKIEFDKGVHPQLPPDVRDALIEDIPGVKIIVKGDTFTIDRISPQSIQNIVKTIAQRLVPRAVQTREIQPVSKSQESTPVEQKVAITLPDTKTPTPPLSVVVPPPPPQPVPTTPATAPPVTTASLTKSRLLVAKTADPITDVSSRAEGQPSNTTEVDTTPVVTTKEGQVAVTPIAAVKQDTLKTLASIRAEVSKWPGFLDLASQEDYLRVSKGLAPGQYYLREVTQGVDASKTILFRLVLRSGVDEKAGLTADIALQKDILNLWTVTVSRWMPFEPNHLLKVASKYNLTGLKAENPITISNIPWGTLPIDLLSHVKFIATDPEFPRISPVTLQEITAPAPEKEKKNKKEPKVVVASAPTMTIADLLNLAVTEPAKEKQPEQPKPTPGESKAIVRRFRFAGDVSEDGNLKELALAIWGPDSPVQVEYEPKVGFFGRTQDPTLYVARSSRTNDDIFTLARHSHDRGVFVELSNKPPAAAVVTVADKTWIVLPIVTDSNGVVRWDSTKTDKTTLDKIRRQLAALS